MIDTKTVNKPVLDDSMDGAFEGLEVGRGPVKLDITADAMVDDDAIDEFTRGPENMSLERTVKYLVNLAGSQDQRTTQNRINSAEDNLVDLVQEALRPDAEKGVQALREQIEQVCNDLKLSPAQINEVRGSLEGSIYAASRDLENHPNQEE